MKTEAVCIVSCAPIRAEASDRSEMVNQLLFGETIRFNMVSSNWIEVETLHDGYKGFMDPKQVRALSHKDFKKWNDGLSPVFKRERLLNTPWGDQYICRGAQAPFRSMEFKLGQAECSWLEDDLNQPDSLIDCTRSYLNTPYLWGGRSPFGIDCSGLVQVVFALFGYRLPRDASEQVTAGDSIPYEEIQPGDLAFFQNKEKKIVHVGIASDHGKIIHASAFVREDPLLKDGIYHSETNIKTHELSAIRRIIW